MSQIRNSYDVLDMGGADASLITFLATYTNLEVVVFGKKDHYPGNDLLTQAHGAAFGFKVFPEIDIQNHITMNGSSSVSLTNGRCVKTKVIIDNQGKVIAGDLETLLSAAETRLLQKMNNLRLVRTWNDLKVPA